MSRLFWLAPDKQVILLLCKNLYFVYGCSSQIICFTSWIIKIRSKTKVRQDLDIFIQNVSIFSSFCLQQKKVTIIVIFGGFNTLGFIVLSASIHYFLTCTSFRGLQFSNRPQKNVWNCTYYVIFFSLMIESTLHISDFSIWNETS